MVLKIVTNKREDNETKPQKYHSDPKRYNTNIDAGTAFRENILTACWEGVTSEIRKRILYPHSQVILQSIYPVLSRATSSIHDRVIFWDTPANIYNANFPNDERHISYERSILNFGYRLIDKFRSAAICPDVLRVTGTPFVG
jgi:hypothetical protein